MFYLRTGRRVQGAGWISSALLEALIALAVSSVSARVCTLLIDLDSRGCGQRMGRFVLPPGDPCTCTEVRLGGHHLPDSPEMQGHDPPVYMGMLPEVTAEVLRSWFNCTETKTPVDCQDILDAGQTTSGVYTIQHKGQTMTVYCRMEEGKGYIVFQRRQDGSVSFNRTWQEFADGFGNLTGEFWLGNDKLYNLTRNRGMELVVTLRAFDGDEARVYYEYFNIDSPLNKYYIGFYGGETGEAGGALAYSNSRHFSTHDADHDSMSDENCAEKFQAGWWYRQCSDRLLESYYKSNLNGLYHNSATVDDYMGIQFSTWKGKNVSLKGCEMMTRSTCLPITELPADCQEILDAGQTASGVYTIRQSCQDIKVFCRMEPEAGKAYIVFQRRQDGSVNFDRTWQEYADGFGSLTGEFWLGGDNIFTIAQNWGWELVITLSAFDGDEARVRYGNFHVPNSWLKYEIYFETFSEENGHAGDALQNVVHVRFSTKDQDNTGGDNCSEIFQGGWWFSGCGESTRWHFKTNLNGVYYPNATVDDYMGIQWSTWKGANVSLKGCEMMTRRIQWYDQ